mmetsp:Transcript_104142/g.335804  ORF Transcript_104142/g.335804 Transcript_104142/m.335804 type:complete len:251 (+) Transcript_104142:59-811(+)
MRGGAASMGGMATLFQASEQPGRDIEAVLRSHRAAQLADNAMRRDRDSVRELLAASADPNCPDEAGRLALHAAAYAGATEVVREMLLARADANLAERERQGNRPLQIAAWMGHTEVTKLLLRASASADATDGRGWTPLCSAAEQGHAATVQVLLSQRAEPGRHASVAGRGSVTPLQVAARGGHVEVAQVLKEALGRPSVSDSPARPRPLHFAAARCARGRAGRSGPFACLGRLADCGCSCWPRPGPGKSS